MYCPGNLDEFFRLKRVDCFPPPLERAVLMRCLPADCHPVGLSWNKAAEPPLKALYTRRSATSGSNKIAVRSEMEILSKRNVRKELRRFEIFDYSKPPLQWSVKLFRHEHEMDIVIKIEVMLAMLITLWKRTNKIGSCE